MHGARDGRCGGAGAGAGGGGGRVVVGPRGSMGVLLLLLLGLLLVPTRPVSCSGGGGGRGDGDATGAPSEATLKGAPDVENTPNLYQRNHIAREVNNVDISTYTSPPPTTLPLFPSSPPGPLPPLHHIGGAFEVANFTEVAVEFIHALNHSVPPTHVRFEAINLQAWSNLHEWLVYICDAVAHNNVTVFLAVGSQDMVNTLAIVTEYVGIPVIGYVTDKITASSTVSS